jgi:1-phosphofructokinase
MNPAIDIFISVDDMQPSIVNRTKEQDVQPNGKAVNISFILRKLGVPSIAMGFSAGFTGRFIEEELSKKGIGVDFIHIDGITRLNIFTNVISKNLEYKLVNPGPTVTVSQVKNLLDNLRGLGKGDILCVSGSLPVGVSEDIYLKIAKEADKNGFDLVLDSSSPAVLDTLFCKPYILKPNNDELAAWFGKKNLSKSEIVKYAQKLVDKGARHVVVSLGADGAVYFGEKGSLYVNAPSGKVVNTACAGDTMLAAFIVKLMRTRSIDEILKFAVAAGSSTAFRPGLTDFSDVYDMAEQLKAEDISQWVKRPK